MIAVEYSSDGSFIASAAGKFVYTTCSNFSAPEDKLQQKIAMQEIREREEALQEQAAAEKAAAEAAEAKRLAEKAAAEARAKAEVACVGCTHMLSGLGCRR